MGDEEINLSHGICLEGAHNRWVIQSDEVAARQEIANECRLAYLPWPYEIDDAGCLKGLFEAGL